MMPPPDLSPWRAGIQPEQAEQRIRWLRERMAEAERAMDAQRALIAHDGELTAYRLSLASLEMALSEHESELADLMRQRHIEVLDFALDGPRYRHHRAQAGALGPFLNALQHLYLRLGQAMSTPRPGAKIAPEIAHLCQLEVAGFFPSSFGVRFVVPTHTDLDGHSLANAALESTFMLVNTDNPLDEVARVGRWTLPKYRKLVATLVEAEATPKATWRTPSGDERHWVSDANRLAVLSNRLAHIKNTEPRLREAVGTLIGASLRRKRFEFDARGEIITGVAPREIADKITAHFGKACTILYQETVFIDESTDQEKKSRVLVDIH